MHNVKLLLELVELLVNINFVHISFFLHHTRGFIWKLKEIVALCFFLVLNFIFHDLFFFFLGVELKDISWC